MVARRNKLIAIVVPWVVGIITSYCVPVNSIVDLYCRYMYSLWCIGTYCIRTMVLVTYANLTHEKCKVAAEKLKVGK